jgi:hypothetical protein
MARSAPGDPIPVALALLDRRQPLTPALADTAGHRAMAALEADPRYVIGRLHQALTDLLTGDFPPADAPTSLLSQALADAIAWRYHRCRPCRHCAQSLCRACTTDWDQADRYHALALTLGAVGDHPSVVSRCSASSRTGSWSRASTSPS